MNMISRVDEIEKYILLKWKTKNHCMILFMVGGLKLGPVHVLIGLKMERDASIWKQLG